MTAQPEPRPTHERVQRLAAVDDRQRVASLVDDVSNRLQVVLGYAQILHELDDDERHDAVRSIEAECVRLRVILGSLTSWSRDPQGSAPWQADPDSTTEQP